MTRLRAGTASDARQIGELAEEAGLFPAAMVDDMIAPFLAGGEGLWIVATGGRSVDGFLFAAPERLTEGTHNLLAMAVRSEHRAQGMGSAMIAAAESQLADRGARILLVETSSRPEFESTSAFYRARGFEDEARIRDFWASGDDKLIFRKVIT